MASWYSKSAEKWCDSASLPIRLHRTTCTLVCVFRPESRVHQSVIMSNMLSTNLFSGGSVAAEVELFPAHYMHQEQQPNRLLHSRPVLQERATSQRSRDRSAFTTLLTGHICALRADRCQCSRTVKVARLKACRKRCGRCQKASSGPWHADIYACAVPSSRRATRATPFLESLRVLAQTSPRCAVDIPLILA